MKLLLPFIFLAILVSACTPGSTDKQSSRLDSCITELSELHGIEIGPPSIVESYQSDSTHPYHYLKDSVSIDQLVELSDHNSKMVRVFSFLILTEKRYEKLDQIICNHIADTAILTVSDYDVIYTETVADYMIYTGFHSLDSAQRDSIRDEIVFNHSSLETFDHIARTCPAHEPYYARFKELAEEGFDPGVVSAIASYQLESDMDYLTGVLDSFMYYEKFDIIEKFPHNRFKPFLEAYIEEIDSDTTYVPANTYYFAVAAYQNNWAVNHMERLMETGPTYPPQYEYHLEKIMQATEKYDSEIYSGIREEIMIKLQGDSLGISYFDFNLYDWWR